MEDTKDHVYDDDEPLDLKYINICRFECNPHLQTTTRARHNSKHVDERTRIVQDPTSKISQAVRCRQHVCRWAWIGMNIWKSFGRVSCRKVSTITIVILLAALHEIIWLDRYVEKKGPTHRSKRVCLGWDRFSNPVILIHLHIWDLRGLRILLCVSVSKAETHHTIDMAYRWWGRVVVCRIVIGSVDVWWILHFTLHNYISYWLRVLEYDIHV